jgi:hypothetical protein
MIQANRAKSEAAAKWNEREGQEMKLVRLLALGPTWNSIELYCWSM